MDKKFEEFQEALVRFPENQGTKELLAIAAQFREMLEQHDATTP
jgi:hypothetical protein